MIRSRALPMLLLGMVGLAIVGWLAPAGREVVPAGLEAKAGEAGAAASVARAPAALDTSRVLAPGAADEVGPDDPDDGLWFEVLVVDGDTGQPVPDAEAVYSDARTRAQLNSLPPVESRRFDADGELLARTFGRRARSDRDGRMRLWLHAGGGWVCARANERFGVLSIVAGAPVGGHRLLLGGDETLRVQVLAADGRPGAGVPVGLVCRARSNAEPPELEPEQLTDEAGIAVFAHVQRRRPTNEASAAMEFVVGVAIPGLDIAPLAIDAGQPLPREPIELRLPPLGGMRVRFLAGGAPWEGGSVARLRPSPTPATGEADIAWDEGADADGWVVFPWLPLACQFVVAPNGSGGSDHAAQLVSGPSRAGEVIDHSFEVADRLIVLRGRLLDEAGVPILDQWIDSQLQAQGTSGAGDLRTDGRGRFVTVLDAPDEGETRELYEWQLRWPARGDLRATVAPRELRVGINEIGDQRLAAESLVCGGRIVGKRNARRAVVLTVERGGISDSAWVPEYWLAIGITEQGLFTVRGTVGPGRYRLRAAADGCVPAAPIEFALGSQDLVVTMERGCRLEVACRLPEGGASRDLALVLRGGPPMAVASTPPWALFADHRHARSVRWQGDVVDYVWPAVEPGRYTLQVELYGLFEPVCAIPDVVLPMPDGGDPRLRAIDLRTAVRLVPVRVTSAGSGERLVDAVLFPFPARQEQQPPESPWLGRAIGRDTKALLLPGGPVDVLLVAPGHRPLRTHLPADEGASLDSALEPWPQLELQLNPGSAVPSACTVLVEVRPRAALRGLRHISRGASGPGSLLPLLQPEVRRIALDAVGAPARVPIGDGVHDLRLTLRCGEREQSLLRATPNEVVAGAPVTIALDAEELAAAAAALAPERGPK